MNPKESGYYWVLKDSIWEIGWFDGIDRWYYIGSRGDFSRLSFQVLGDKIEIPNNYYDG